jgi:hypothetical protein
LGSFFDFKPQRGSYEVNPPFSPPMMLRAFQHLESLLHKSQKKISKHRKTISETTTTTTTTTTSTTTTTTTSSSSSSSEKGKNKKRMKTEPTATTSEDGSVGSDTISTMKYPMSFVMIVPVWEDSEVWPLLMKSKFLKGHISVKKEEHAWRECSPKITSKLCGKAARRVPCDTAVRKRKRRKNEDVCIMLTQYVIYACLSRMGFLSIIVFFIFIFIC